MPVAYVLCPTVTDESTTAEDFFSIADARDQVGAVRFEFEEEDGPPAEINETATLLRGRLLAAVDILVESRFSMVLPVRSSRLWEPLPFPPAPDVDLFLTLLTARSIGTSIESTYLAVVASHIPQVCVGIDTKVPEPLRSLLRVPALDPDDPDARLVRILSDIARLA